MNEIPTEDERTLERVRLMVSGLDNEDVIYCMVAAYQREIKIHKAHVKTQDSWIWFWSLQAIGLQILILWWCV